MPEQEVSIHGLLRALTYKVQTETGPLVVSIHGLLRALTLISLYNVRIQKFQSTGSYEP